MVSKGEWQVIALISHIYVADYFLLANSRTLSNDRHYFNFHLIRPNFTMSALAEF